MKILFGFSNFIERYSYKLWINHIQLLISNTVDESEGVAS